MFTENTKKSDLDNMLRWSDYFSLAVASNNFFQYIFTQSRTLLIRLIDISISGVRRRGRFQKLMEICLSLSLPGSSVYNAR